MKIRLFLIFLALALLLPACAPSPAVPTVYSAGFGCVDLPVPTGSADPCYIAGYHGGWEITGVLDLQQARALWLDDGSASTVIIAVDCIGLGSDTVAQIRQRLSDFSRRTGCDGIHVVATHTHAGIDTLGLWGPVAEDGKNPAFMQTVIDGAVKAAEQAYADRSTGTLYYSATETEGLQKDSRAPQTFDNKVYQLRFAPDDPAQNGIRLFSFAAHAEALRGDNTKVSRDYPGVVCDLIRQQTGDDALYLPGAIGGLIMTPELVNDPFDAEENLLLTGKMLATYVLQPQQERRLEPSLKMATVNFETELDNTLFMYYKFLGILGNPVRRDLSGEYYLKTELSVLQLADVTLAMIPGELCPELVTGTADARDSQGLSQIARQQGIQELVIVGLANDELGYILPPSDFKLDDELPYLKEAEGDHYEETNSPGPACAWDVAKAFANALGEI